MHTGLLVPIHITMEEAKELKFVIQRMKEENKELLLNLLRVTKDKDNQKWDLKRKKTKIQENVERTNKE